MRLFQILQHARFAPAVGRRLGDEGRASRPSRPSRSSAIRHDGVVIDGARRGQDDLIGRVVAGR